MATTIRLTADEMMMVSYIMEAQKFSTKSKAISFCIKKAYDIMKDMRVTQ